MRSAICTAAIWASSSVQSLAVAVASARTQLAAGVEVLALDDGSSRSVTAWLNARAKEWPALRILKIAGLTPARARNGVIEAARAPFIAFLDPSCWWWPGKIAEQAGYHGANREIAFSFTDYLRVLPNGESLGGSFAQWQIPAMRRPKAGYFRLSGALQAALASNAVGTSTVMASKAALEKAGGFRDLPAASEWDLWLRLAAKSPAACSRAVTATCPVQAEAAEALQQRIGAMKEILIPYESSRAASIRHAAVKARAQLDCASAELSKPARRRSPAVRANFWPLAASAQAKATSVNAALDFAGAYGVGK
jgi:hypothetical protein